MPRSHAQCRRRRGSLPPGVAGVIFVFLEPRRVSQEPVRLDPCKTVTEDIVVAAGTASLFDSVSQSQ